MDGHYLSSRDVIAIHPIRAMLLPVPFVCFTAALATDLAYWRSANVQWETFSVWLLAVGLVMAGVGIVAGLFDILLQRRTSGLVPAWWQMIGYCLALALSVVNAFVHSRDGYTAVVPTGLALSAIVVVLLVVTMWNGVAMFYRGTITGAN